LIRTSALPYLVWGLLVLILRKNVNPLILITRNLCCYHLNVQYDSIQDLPLKMNSNKEVLMMNEKITFAKLVDKIAEETGASKQLIHDLLIETVNLTREGLNRDGYTNLSGLGRFRLKWHKARSGRNPKTGEKIEIPGHNTVNFKAGANLREYINRKYSHLQPEIIKKTSPPPARPEKEEEKKRFARWPWLVIPLLIIILAFIFWPSLKKSTRMFQFRLKKQNSPKSNR
jgi:DNA-binding protein HU-beta